MGSLGWSSTELQWKKAHLKNKDLKLLQTARVTVINKETCTMNTKEVKLISVDSAALYLHAGMHHYKG